MSTQINIKVDPDLKQKLTALARSEGKTASDVVRGLIEGYVKERDIDSYIDRLWDRIGDKLKSGGLRSENIEDAVKAVRKGKRGADCH